MSKKGEQKVQNKGPKKETSPISKAEEPLNLANNPISDNYTIKSISKSSQKQKPTSIATPIISKEIPVQKKSILREFPQPDEYNVLKMSGILDAYQHFLKLLCKHGLPTGKVFEYAAQQIEKYEKRKLNKELKMRAELDIQKIKKGKPEHSPQKPFHPSPSPYLQR